MFEDVLAKITEHQSKNLPFVLYRKPKEKKAIALFQKDDSLNYLKSFADSGFVFAPFDNRKEIVLLREDERFEAEIDSSAATSGMRTKPAFDVTGQKKAHIDLVQKGITEINAGNFKKVVLSRKVEVAYTTSPVVLIQSVMGTYPNAFCYLWHHPKIGTWLGATPEILVKAEQGQITTMSLAGTQHFNGETDPVWGRKEQEEQELVTNYITNVLSDKVTKLIVSDRETVRAGSLVHLRTKLVANYEEKRLGEIVNALHPTPAICGMPTRLTKEFILLNENYSRGYYTGYLGELNLKHEIGRSARKRNIENNVYRSRRTATTFFVNLRCMQLREGKALIYVGGGITKDSDPEKEWEETVAKSDTMLRIL